MSSLNFDIWTTICRTAYPPQAGTHKKSGGFCGSQTFLVKLGLYTFLYYMNSICNFSLALLSIVIFHSGSLGQLSLIMHGMHYFSERFLTSFCHVCVPHPWQKYKGFRLLCYFQAFVLYVFFPQILQAEKDNQEMQHQLQLSELMNKHAKEMRDLG